MTTLLSSLTAAAPLVTWSFVALISLSLALHVAVHVVPRSLVRFMSVPWAFQLQRAGDLRYHAVLYAAFHTRRLARVSHYSLAWEQPLWFALLWTLHPALGLTAWALLCWQAALVRDLRLTAVIVLAWSLALALGAGLVALVGEVNAAALSMTVLVLGGVVRVLGHALEPLPPGLGARGRFVPVRSAGPTFRVIIAPLVGVLCEFAASFPSRLFMVQILWLADRGGLPSPRPGTRAEHERAACQVHARGWAASSATAWMLHAERGGTP